MTLTCEDLDVELPQLSFLELRNCGTEAHVEAVAAQLRSRCPKLVKDACHLGTRRLQTAAT
jgi:hypothetical protein